MGIILLVLCVGALLIAIWSQTRPQPILFVSNILLAVAIALVAAKEAGWVNLH